MATPILPLLAAHRERIEAAYLARAIKRDGCWGWSGTINNHGRPMMPMVAGKYLQAHRVAYVLRHEEDPGDLLVCHHCDNPVCTNPDHLFLGTALDNNRDAMQKNRCRHKLTPKDRDDIIRVCSYGISQRDVAVLFGVHHNTVNYLTRGRTWNP